MAVEVSRRYVLGEFELEPDKFLLRRGQEAVHLSELPFRVLLYLVEHRDRYVSRQELLDRFWAGSDSYEETLTRCISTIRTQLGDPPNAPRFIETRKKVGYRYVGPAEEVTEPEGLIVALEKTRAVRVIIEEDDGAPGDSYPTARAEPARDISPEPLPPAPRLVTRPVVVATTISLVALATVALALYLWAGKRSPPPARPNSVAVLPLKNLSGDPLNDYFSDGLTESLITSLSRVEGLKVISRSSVFRFKGRDVDPQEVGRQLGVAAVLEGSVRRSADSVRVDVRLVGVDDGRVLFVSDAGGHMPGDVFALQDEVARNVASGLRVKLSGDDERRLTRRYTDDAEAYDLYMQGRFYFNDPQVERAIQHFDAAIAKDPNYALAYTGLADSYISLGLDADQARDPREVMPKAKAYALKALELDPKLGEAHYSLGAVEYFYDWDWPEARRELALALQLDAKSVESNTCYLHSLDTMGQPDEALAQVRRALDKNPLSVSISGELGCTSYYARRYDRAIDFSRETLRTNPDYDVASYNLARALGQQRKYDEAAAALEKVIGSGVRPPALVAELGYDYAAAGRRAEARKLLDELKGRAAREFVDPYPVAFIYAALGEKGEALSWLEKAFEARSTWMPWLKVEPKFDALQAEPRFQALVRRVGLP